MSHPVAHRVTPVQLGITRKAQKQGQATAGPVFAAVRSGFKSPTDADPQDAHIDEDRRSYTAKRRARFGDRAALHLGRSRSPSGSGPLAVHRQLGR